MKPLYSSLPAYAGTISPMLSEYVNLPPISTLYPDNYITVPDNNFIFNGVSRKLLEKKLSYYMNKDVSPIPCTSDREFYHGERHLEWWCSGLLTFFRVCELFSIYNRPIREGDVFFELGCATGRVLRHSLYQSDKLSVFGCDINARHVDWMKQFLPNNALIFQNSDYPSLPLEDNSVNIAIACSVFTHIDKLEDCWLMELRRIMNKDGLLFITVMSDFFWDKCGNNDNWNWFIDQFLKLKSEFNITRDSFKSKMPAERVVLYDTHSNVYSTDVFHSIEYINKFFSRYFYIVNITESEFDMQDLVILRKK